MGVSDLIKLGQTAKQLAGGISDINTINNVLIPRYNSLLDKAKTLTGNPDILLSDLTDNQINVGLLDGRGTVNDIAEAKATIVAWEDIAIVVQTRVDTLPVVDI
jgi:hypothetical protein